MREKILYLTDTLFRIVQQVIIAGERGLESMANGYHVRAYRVHDFKTVRIDITEDKSNDSRTNSRPG